MNRWTLTAGGIAVVFGLLGSWTLARRVEITPARATSSLPAASATNTSPFPAVDPSEDVASEPLTAGPRVVAIAAVPGEDPLSLRWDDLTGPERVGELLEAYRLALAQMRKGEDWSSAHSRADAALSALRGELYATRRGRTQHQRLERQLEELVESAPASGGRGGRGGLP